MRHDGGDLRIEELNVSGGTVLVIKNNSGQIVFNSQNPHTSRKRWLKRALRDSVTRAKRYWRAAGVPDGMAEGLATSPSLGAIGTAPNIATAVTVLLGDLGAGKSLACERLYRAALLQAIADDSAPLPVFFGPPWHDNSSLLDMRSAVEQAIAGVADLDICGAAVIVDGPDQAGDIHAARALEQAQLVAAEWPSTAVLLASRPIPSMRQPQGPSDPRISWANIRALSDDQTLALVSQFARRQISEWELAKLPPSLLEAVRRPLFAILYGIHLSSANAGNSPPSLGQLLAQLVERSLAQSHAQVDASLPMLRRLGAHSVERGGLVAWNDVRTEGSLRDVLDSGLVLERNNGQYLEFTLPLLGEYFAALSLEAGEIDPEALSADSARLTRWRYALVVFLALANWERSLEVFAPVAQADPGLAADIISQALPEARLASESHLPSWDAAGRQLRSSMATWADGIGDNLASLIAPLDPSGSLPSVGVHVSDGNVLVAGWFRRENAAVDVVKLPPFPWDPAREAEIMRACGRVVHASAADHPAWAWAWTLERLRESLKSELEYRKLPIATEPLAAEIMLLRAQAFASHRGGIGLDQLEAALAVYVDRPEHANTHYSLNGVAMTAADMDELLSYVRRRRAAGHTKLRPPWPGPDLPRSGASWIWSPYSPEQMLRRTREVFQAAIDGYEQIVRTFFWRFHPRLGTFVLLPLKVIGHLNPSGASMQGSPVPTLSWFLMPLPDGETSTVDIELGQTSFAWDELRQARERALELRGDRAAWISRIPNSSGILDDVFGMTPATEIAYQLLGDDLKETAWLEHSLGSPLRRM